MAARRKTVSWRRKWPSCMGRCKQQIVPYRNAYIRSGEKPQKKSLGPTGFAAFDTEAKQNLPEKSFTYSTQ
jgi:hypothetical protein